MFRSRRWGTYDWEYLHELAEEWVGRRRRTRATAVVYLSGTPLARSLIPRSAPPPPRPTLPRSFKQPRRRASIYPNSPFTEKQCRVICALNPASSLCTLYSDRRGDPRRDAYYTVSAFPSARLSRPTGASSDRRRVRVRARAYARAAGQPKVHADRPAGRERASERRARPAAKTATRSLTIQRPHLPRSLRYRARAAPRPSPADTTTRRVSVRHGDASTLHA